MAAPPAVFLVGRPKVAWKWIVAVGLVLGVAKFGLVFVGMDTGMPAGLSSLVLQIQAVFTAVIAAAVLGERPTGVKVLGMVVALAGIGVAALDEGASGPLGAFVLVVGAAAAWGLSNVLTRKASPPDALNFMVWVSTVRAGAPPAGPLPRDGGPVPGPRGPAGARLWQGAGTILFVAWVSTVFGFGAWGWLLHRHPALHGRAVLLLVPVFGMSSAALFLGESVTPLRWCAAALLVGGVALTTLTPARRGRGQAAGRGSRPARSPLDGRPRGRKNPSGDIQP